MTTNYPRPTDELRAVIRKNLLGLLLSLVALGILAALLMTQFRPYVDSFTETVFRLVGLPGMYVIVFITDSLISPLPPDSILLLVAASPYHEDWLLVIPSMGLTSAIAGWAGYFCGAYFSTKAWAKRVLDPIRERGGHLILRFGSWAVVLGALTPVPFSITCWSAGLLHVPFRSVWFPCLLRIPRYVAYYAVIAYFPRLF